MLTAGQDLPDPLFFCVCFYVRTGRKELNHHETWQTMTVLSLRTK